MQYQIAIDPKFELSAEEFVAAWNASQHGGEVLAQMGQAVWDAGACGRQAQVAEQGKELHHWCKL